MRSELCCWPRAVRGVAAAAVVAAIVAPVACATGAPAFPWRTSGAAASGTRADVDTVNAGYRRTTSQILVRRIHRPTLASLDYAAYHANFMNADPAPERPADAGHRADASRPFGGAIALDSLTASIGKTPLSDDERAHPLALPPLVELLASKRVSGADRLEDVMSRIRAESWGLPGGPQFVRQTAAEAYLHAPGGGRPIEVWVKIEFAPWFRAFSDLPDEDRDGVPEIYGRIAPDALGDATAIARFIRDEYEGRVLTPAEVAGWAHRLASYWYPSYNTDLVDARAGWPSPDTEADIRKEAGDLHLAAPSVVMRGKPAGKAVYNVFVLDQTGGASAAGTAPARKTTPALPPSVPTPDTAPVARAVRAEVAAHGGSWGAWSKEVAPLHAALKARLGAVPAGAKALPGGDGFLFYARSLSYVLGGDLAKQRGNKNPIPAIVRFKDLLAKHGVDLLFVPVPTKVEIFPERAATAPGGDAAPFARFVGQVANPFERKLIADLAASGVETVDLLPAFLAERARDGQANKTGKQEPLYQAEDTHWTARGLELAARLVAERVRRYPWYRPLAAHRRSYQTKDASFSRHGDLCSRLPEAEQARYQPETLVGHQVVAEDGGLYDDDPDSPIVLLGDSFTGVYQLMDCEHAGVSAHLAKDLGTPVDLVMSYGGGPNVRSKLLRRGEAALGSKKLVIWMMTARDLFDFADGWER
jgi:alginate O-acetyltransferase complex protein AlgJ